MPAVSVIVPTYNQSQYISHALESILKQTYNDYEIIVVDDGSPDDTKNKVKPFGESIRYIYQEHKGRGSARQHGVDESRGRYIAFLDSDDIWLPDKLRKQMAYIEKKSFSGLLHARVSIIDKDGKELKKENKKLNRAYYQAARDGFGYINLLRRCPLFLSSAILPKKLILKIGGFREDYRVREDFDFILRLALISTVAFLDESLIYHRNHPANTAIAEKKDVETEYISIFNDRLQQLNKITNLTDRKKAEIYILDHLFNFSFELGDRHRAFTYFKELIRKQPSQIFTIRRLKNLMKLFNK